MKLLLLEETEFRGKTIKENRKADIPDGVAHKLIANGKAKKITDAEFEAFDVNEALELEDFNVLKVDELKEVCKHLDLPASGNKGELVALIEEATEKEEIDLDKSEDE